MARSPATVSVLPLTRKTVDAASTSRWITSENCDARSSEEVLIELVEISRNENQVRCRLDQPVDRLILVGPDRGGLEIGQHADTNRLPDAFDGQLHRIRPQPERLNMSRVDAHRNRQQRRTTESRDGSGTLTSQHQHDRAGQRNTDGEHQIDDVDDREPIEPGDSKRTGAEDERANDPDGRGTNSHQPVVDPPADPHNRSDTRHRADNDGGRDRVVVQEHPPNDTATSAKLRATRTVDKPMRGHGLMQAIARVNRVFRDKPGGLVVDYLGLAHELKRALAAYTQSGGKGETALDQAEAVAVMLEKHEVCRDLFWGFDWSNWADGDAQTRLGLLSAALEHILAQRDGKDRCTAAVRELSQAFALSVPDPAALSIRDDVAFFQAVAAALSKPTPGETRHEEDLDHAVRQIISRAVAPHGVLDIFAAAGLDKPDISVLSEEFLAEVRGLPQRNLAVEALRRLLQGEVTRRRSRNVVQARSFAEMLEKAILRYQNRAIEAAQVIEELIGIAEEIREADARGEQLGLTDDELAFYDALETNDSAVKVLGDETLRAIACELVETVRNNVTIDWTMRENVRANIRRLVRRILRRHGYPPDKQEKATKTVLEQAEALSATWAVSA